MANTKDIRAKIISTTKSQQTTKAMKVVSAAKLRRAQSAIVNARPYAHKIYSIIQNLAQAQQLQHPLLTQEKKEGRTLLVVLTSDRGLCGSFNSGIIKYARSYYQQNPSNMDIIFIGRKGADFFRKQMGVEAKKVITNLAKDVSYDLALKVAEELLSAYLSGEYSEIRLIYNEFKSAISQNVTDEQLLPLSAPKEMPKETEYSRDYIFEPEAAEILEQLVRKHFTVQVYRCMLESIASEHGSRMSAMENATRNAGEMIKSLTLTYNKIRQAAITTELIEITSGAEAIKN